MERRLAAILAADLVGYTRLMGDDEAGTLRRLTELRKQILEPLIAKHRGRIVKLMGDGLLVEFASVIDAVACAQVWQDSVTKRDAGRDEERRLQYRIGINLGDVIVEDDDLYGEGVNIAARLEGLAEPGGICIAHNVFDQLGNKVEASFEDLGELQVKNVAKPVRVYRVLPDTETPGRVVVATSAKLRRWKWPAMVAAVAVLAMLVAGYFDVFPIRRVPPENQAVSEAGLAVPLPGKPSIAVLPFKNLSDDPEQEYFADGMTEDLITDLSKISGLFVIARNSSFAYKDRSPDARQVAQELGVRYLLEGSIRRSADRLRINAQLIDATTGGHLWAERYDEALDEVFALQDRVIRRIVSSLEVTLTDGDVQQLEAQLRPVNLAAYEWLLRGRQQLAKLDSENSAMARTYFEKAIEADNSFARAYTNLGLSYWNEWRLWGRSRDENLAKALEFGKKAVELDPKAAGANLLIALVHQYRGEHEEAEEWGNRTLALNPTQAETLGNLGAYLRNANRYEEAIEVLQKAIRLDPLHPPHWLAWLGLNFFMTNRIDEAMNVLHQAIEQEPDYIASHLYLAACYAVRENLELASQEVKEVLRLNPNFTIRAYINYAGRSSKDRSSVLPLAEALRKTGLPE